MEASKGTVSAVLQNRRIIPRWRSPSEAVEGTKARVRSAESNASAGTSWITRLTESFAQLPSKATAVELYETAFLYGKEQLIPAEALKLTEHFRESSSALIRSTQENDLVLSSKSETAEHQLSHHFERAAANIKLIRKSLTLNSDRPLAWSELARHYLAVGEDKKAVKAMQAALHLGKTSRYVARAATRLFIHVDKPDRALHVLHRHAGVRYDPWLLAAEIATNSIIGKTSAHIRTARSIITSNQSSPRDISELSAALATIELVSGAHKKAKALFNLSLTDPTENTVAQAQWASERDSKIVIPVQAWDTPASNEARALAFRNSRQWGDAMRACAAWLADEPYSVRPSALGSFMGLLPEHVVMAEQFASAGLKSDQHNSLLLNNRAVSRAYQGKLSEAFDDVKNALNDKTAREDALLLATLGLVAFRGGQPNLGREYYSLSVEWFSFEKDRRSVAAALLHWAKEEVRIDSTASPAAERIAKKVIKSGLAAREPELMGLAETFIQKDSKQPKDKPDTKAAIDANPASLSTDELSHQRLLFNVPEKAHRPSLKLLKDSDFD